MCVVRERFDHVGPGVNELAVELRDELGLFEHDLRDERAGLQIPPALELEEVPLGADDGPLLQPLEQSLCSLVGVAHRSSLPVSCIYDNSSCHYVHTRASDRKQARGDRAQGCNLTFIRRNLGNIGC